MADVVNEIVIYDVFSISVFYANVFMMSDMLRGHLLCADRQVAGNLCQQCKASDAISARVGEPSPPPGGPPERS